MNEQQNNATQHSSPAERRWRRLIVPAPAAYDPARRIDVIHDPDLDLLWRGAH